MLEYRKNYLTYTKKLFERLRNIYDRDLLGKKRKKPILYFEDFTNFIKRLISLCFSQIYPDVIFQLVNPAIEILSLINQFFGMKNSEIRKGTIVEGCNFLATTSFFDSCNFYNLVNCLQSSFESVRSLTHELLKAFSNLHKED